MIVSHGGPDVLQDYGHGVQGIGAHCCRSKIWGVVHGTMVGSHVEEEQTNLLLWQRIEIEGCRV
jgi:hypothetical protein